MALFDVGMKAIIYVVRTTRIEADTQEEADALSEAMVADGRVITRESIVDDLRRIRPERSAETDYQWIPIVPDIDDPVFKVFLDDEDDKVS
jgi:hypothetical protein